MIWQDLCRLMKFTSGWINVSHWIEFIGFWKVFLVELNAWNCCPEHIVTIEWISIYSYGLGYSMHDASICNNWRVSKWLKYECHHQWTVSKWFQFIIFLWITSLTEAFHDKKFHQKCNVTLNNAVVETEKFHQKLSLEIYCMQSFMYTVVYDLMSSIMVSW